MLEKNFHWRNTEMRKHVAVVDGKRAPSLVLKDAVYLNAYTKKWTEAHIWIDGDRIIYVGSEWPANTDGTEIVDCTDQYLVPGYVEPHAHPFQLYNPETLARQAAAYGTTTLVNDNLMWHFLLNKKKAFSLLDAFQSLPVSMYWWARLDSQTALQDEESLFNTKDILSWLAHPAVIQGGELTAWPSLLDGDDILLYWIQEAKRKGKPVEGHLAGASEKTLTKMKLLGVDGEHEAISGEDVFKRLELGYNVGMRYSSIRPDLPQILEELLAKGLTNFENTTMTTDGSTPNFYEQGLMNICIDIAIQKGVPVEEAYQMATFNPARHFGLHDQIGSITPGRIAHINFLEAKDNPHPKRVLAKGKWVAEDGVFLKERQIDWEQHGLGPAELSWDIDESDLQFSIPVGLKMLNDVIIEPYAIEVDVSLEQLPINNDDAFLVLLDKHGEWRVNTTIKGFTKELGAIVSSYSTTGDIVLIGKNKQDMRTAFQRMKALGGGIVAVHNGDILTEMPLTLGGAMYNGSMADLIAKEKELREILVQHGYPFSDPIYSILFLSSTHLPYIRITQQGIIDVKKREVLFPAIMR
ncbi:Adenine deaminase [Lentibacillus sp. JNUCC-1]|uniref:adenine deaminase C-terminal domain-containing protein n=1 Tax=Lentibacillus sp. JNUCC-1 TaxID=2654513 RepID=UPI00132BDAEB|nr:adenine deaminase C-terminal domain-containing protein [Lentibacillus sp. JNUCC-1]MUV38590.1 Adenine deaminase [Lentibacillus sp. JNUCC-1]